MKTSFFVRLVLPLETGPEVREALSQILVKVASRFSFQGLEDWSVDVGDGTKVLGAEREFHDLRAQGQMNRELRAYFARKADGFLFSRLVRASFEDLRVFPPRALAAKDWMKEWRKYYRTQKVEGGGRKLWIVPAWKKSPKGFAVKIHPGQAFGTGTHATTRLCLQFFLEIEGLPRRARVLDFGAGTGVLSLGALAVEKSLGAVVAVESDPEGVKACGKNARLNRRKLVVRRRLPARGQFDFIFANVLGPVLLEYKTELVKRLAPGGRLVVSGILREDQEFVEKFSPGLQMIVGG